MSIVDHNCAWCGIPCDGSFPYVLGPSVRGHLCRTHGMALQGAVDQFAARLMREEREERKEARRLLLKARAEQDRMNALAAEGLPRAKRKGEAA